MNHNPDLGLSGFWIRIPTKRKINRVRAESFSALRAWSLLDQAHDKGWDLKFKIVDDRSKDFRPGDSLQVQNTCPEFGLEKFRKKVLKEDVL